MPGDAAEPCEAASHTCSPQLMLALLASLYDQRPAALFVTAPGIDFGHGEELNPATAQRLSDLKAVTETLLVRLHA